MNKTATKEFLDEREGIRMYSGNQSEFLAIKGAEDDLKNYLSRNNKKPDLPNDPFMALKSVFRSERT